MNTEDRKQRAQQMLDMLAKAGYTPGQIKEVLHLSKRKLLQMKLQQPQMQN